MACDEKDFEPIMNKKLLPLRIWNRNIMRLTFLKFHFIISFNYAVHWLDVYIVYETILLIILSSGLHRAIPLLLTILT